MTELICKECASEKRIFDPIMYLSVPVRNSENKEISCLSECLKNYFQDELLEGNNQLECDKCNKKQDFIKKTALMKPPHFLIIHFKRFFVGLEGIEKSDQFIDFLVDDMEIQQFCLSIEQKQVKYQLFAVCCHKGVTESGHYYSYATNNMSEWYVFSDDQYQSVEEQQIKSNNAYLLFYVKKDLKSF